MKKNKILTHFREVLGLNTAELGKKLNLNEGNILAIENGTQAISPEIIKFYSTRLNIDKSVMNALFNNHGKNQAIVTYLQNFTLSVLLRYLEFGKWLCSFDETQPR
jgi:hypothetical protein